MNTIVIFLFLIVGLLLLRYMQKKCQNEKQALKESEHCFRTIFDNVSDGILVAEISSKKFLTGNHKICQMLGYSLEELKKLSLIDIHPPETVPEILTPFENLSRPESSIAKDIAVKTKNGHIFYVDIRYSPKITFGGKEYLVGIFRDITESKTIEKALTESEELHRAILNDISDAVFITDDRGVFTFICPNVNHIFGYSHLEIQALGNISTLLGETLFTPEALRELGEFQIEREVIDKFGQAHFLQIIVKPITIKNGTMLYTCSDITERKKAEEALAERLAMEQTLSSLSRNFINVTPDELNDEINHALQLIGEFAQVDRSHTCQLSENSQFMKNTNEWCTPGMEPKIKFIKRFSIEKFPWFWDKLTRFETIHIPRMSEAPPEASAEKHIFQQLHIQSLVVVPMAYQGVLIGCLGFDSVKCEKSWKKEDFLLLKTVADIFANALARQSADEKLRQLSSAVEQSANSIVITDNQGTIEYVNPRFTQLTGYRFEEAIGQTPRLLKSGKTPLETYQQLWNTISSGGEWRGEFCNRKKNGELYWEFTAISPIKNAASMITHFIGIKEDMTERKHVEEALRKEKDKIQTYLDIAGVMFIALDSNQTVTLINQKGCEILGYQEQEVIGKNWFAHFIPEFEKEALSAIFARLMRGELENFKYLENSIRNQQGEERIIAWHTTLLYDEEGNIIGSLSSGEDITQRKQTEKALLQEKAFLAKRVEERTAELSRANAELARAARLKDEFLANMSHELRTPLNAILNLSESLQENLLGPLTEKQLRYVCNIETSGRHLLSLINDILDISKIEAGKMVLNIEPAFLKEVCQSSLNFIKQLALKKRLHMVTDFDATIKMVQLDSRRLKQILVNLLGNAIKFTPEGGEIGLSVVGDAAQEVVHLTVSDTGIGIAEYDMKKLFQPFMQIDSGLSRHYEGTGLGLALVRRLAEMHGGSVSVTSEVGKGSRFLVSLPWREPTRQEMIALADSEYISPVTNQPISRTLHNKLILLAEDNEDNIRSISEYLLLKGYRIIVARNGAETIERAKEEKPNVILMDIQMPVMDGLEAIKRIRADDTKLAKVPIIALTALAMPGDKERCLAAGADKYLSKPVQLKQLVNLIEESSE